MNEYELLLDDLDLCNCGNPKETVEWIRDGMCFLAERCPDCPSAQKEWYPDYKTRQLKHFGSDAAFQFFANWANTQGYAEHGSNIIASWLTGAGGVLLERIEKVWKNLPEGA